MAEHSEKRKHIREVVVHETWELIGISAFLAAFFVSLTIYRRLLLREYNIAYYEYGFALVESLVLGKVILLGEALHLGERFHEGSLILSTLWKTAVFGVLVVIFSVLEHFIGALVHGKSLASLLPEFMGSHVYEILARLLVTLVAFVPLFAFREVGRVMGPGKLYKLFFNRSSIAREMPPSSARS